MNKDYKCPKCGNTKNFKIVSLDTVIQSYDQETGEWGTSDFGDESYIQEVFCEECGIQLPVEPEMRLRELKQAYRKWGQENQKEDGDPDKAYDNFIELCGKVLS